MPNPWDTEDDFRYFIVENIDCFVVRNPGTGTLTGYVKDTTNSMLLMSAVITVGAKIVWPHINHSGSILWRLRELRESPAGSSYFIYPAQDTNHYLTLHFDSENDFAPFIPHGSAYSSNPKDYRNMTFVSLETARLATQVAKLCRAKL